MVYDPRTTEFIDRRKKEGLTKKEEVRCPKRYVAERFSASYLRRVAQSGHRCRAVTGEPDFDRSWTVSDFNGHSRQGQQPTRFPKCEASGFVKM